MADTEEHPISYYFESSDESVLTVDENGLVTAVGEGAASVTVSLAQNTDITQTVEIEVPAAETEYVAFTTTLPNRMHEWESIEIGAAFFQNGLKTNYTVEISVDGAQPGAFSVVRDYSDEGVALSDTVHSNETEAGDVDFDNRITLTAYHASQKPVTITASYGSYTATAEIYLIT